MTMFYLSLVIQGLVVAYAWALMAGATTPVRPVAQTSNHEGSKNHEGTMNSRC